MESNYAYEKRMMCICESNKPNKPSPSPKEMESELFNAIWKVIKTWDIKIPEYDNGYMSANGSHVKLLIDVVIPAMREQKIDDIIDGI